MDIKQFCLYVGLLAPHPRQRSALHRIFRKA